MKRKQTTTLSKIVKHFVMGYLPTYEKETGNLRKLMTSSAEKFLISSREFT